MKLQKRQMYPAIGTQTAGCITFKRKVDYRRRSHETTEATKRSEGLSVRELDGAALARVDMPTLDEYRSIVVVASYARAPATLLQ